MDGFIDEHGRTYGRTERGNINFGDLSRILLGEQGQYGCRYVDGKLPGYPDLSKDLNLEGDSSDEYGLAVTPEHAEELVNRINAFRSLCINREYNPLTHHLEGIDEARREELAEFLRERGLPLPSEV